jgi:NAD(P)-dependent dehydrogenase (short-subunit alcohol dehydrogenase family)
MAAVVDVADHAAVTDFAAAVAGQLGPIDLWINNAAVIDPVAPLRDQTPEAVATMLGTNVVGVWNGTAAFVRHRRNVGGGGTVINVSSGVALRASAGTGLYAASKAAVDRLTEATALEEADHDIAAWAIQPGIIDTAMQTSLRTAPPEAFPRAAEFRVFHEQGAFNPGSYVADWLLAIAFDPSFRPPSVAWRIPDQRPRPLPSGRGTTDRTASP